MDENKSLKPRSLLDICLDVQDKLAQAIGCCDNALSPLIFPNETITKILNLVQDIKKVNTTSIPKNTLAYIDNMGDVILKLAELANNNFYDNGLRLFQHNLQIAIKNSSDFPKHKLTMPECTWLELTNSTLILTMSLTLTPNFLDNDDLPLFALRENNLDSITENSSQYVKDFKESLLELIKFVDVLRNSYVFLNLLNSLVVNVQEYRIEKSGVIDSSSKKIINLAFKHEITSNQEKQITCAEIIEIMRNKLNSQADQPHDELIADFEVVFNDNLKREYKFENSVHIIDKLMSYFAKFFPKPGTFRDTIHLFSQIVFNFSSVLTAFYKLLKTIVNSAEVLSLVSEMHTLEESLLKLKESGEIPDKWTPEMCEDFETKVKAFIRIGTVLFNASTLVLEANQLIGKTEIYLDISDLIPIKIGKEFTQINYSPNHEEKIAQNSNLISSISFGEILNVRDLKNISPANFINLFAEIFNMIDELSKSIFRYWIDQKLNGQQVSKTILSDLHDKVASLVLDANRIPLEIVSISKLFYILFELDFNLDNTKFVSTMLKDLSKIYSVYAFFNDLEILGLSNATVCSHLSFIVTILSQYGQNSLVALRDFVNSLNILNIDFQSLSVHMDESMNYVGQIYSIFSVQYQSKNLITLKEISKTILNYSQNINQQVKSMLETICTRVISLECKTMQAAELLDISLEIAFLVKFFQRQNSEQDLTSLLIKMKGYLDKLMQIVRQKPMLLAFIRFMQGYSSKFNPKKEVEKVTNEKFQKSDKTVEISDYQDKDSEHYRSFFAKCHGADEIQYEKNEEEKNETEDLKFEEISKEKKDEDMIKMERTPLPVFGNFTAQYYFEYCREEWNFPGIIDLFNTFEQNMASSDVNPMINSLGKEICHKIKEYIRSIVSQLSDYVRKSYNNQQNMSNAVQEREFSRALTAIVPRVAIDSYLWVTNLIDLSMITYTIYDIMDVTESQLNPILALRSLAVRSHSLITFLRTIGFHPFDLDLKLLGSFVIFILNQRQFLTVKDDQNLNGLRKICESSSSIFSDFISISDSRRIFDVFEMVKACVSFEKGRQIALQNIKRKYQILSSILDDTEFSEIISQKSLVFRYVLSDFNRDYIGNEIMAISSIKENVAQVRNVCNALLCLQNLADLAKNVDTLSPLMIQNLSNGVNSLSITSLSLILFELRYKISRLMELRTTETVSLEFSVRSLLTFFERYLQSFGTISMDDIKELPQKYNSLVKEFNDFNFTSLVDAFSKNFMFFMAFVEEMNFNDENNDFKCLLILVNEVRTIPSKTVCQKMIFALNFVKEKIDEQNFTSLVEKLTNDLKSMSLYFEIYELLMQSTSKVRNITNSTVDFPVISLKKGTEVNELNMKSDKLQSELSLFDQTALVTMTSSLFDANLAMEEKLLELRKLEKQNLEKDEEIKSLQNDIKALEESKQILLTKEEDVDEDIQADQEENDTIKIGNYEKPKYLEDSMKIHGKILNGLESASKTRKYLQNDLEFVQIKNEKSENNELPQKYESKTNSIMQSLQNWQNLE